jgi:hypothetical protein
LVEGVSLLAIIFNVLGAHDDFQVSAEHKIHHSEKYAHDFLKVTIYQ